jgi:hypothetical protein
MNTMEILENKIPELTQEDLILLLDWVTQALKRQAIVSKKRPVFGSAKGKYKILPGFDDPLVKEPSALDKGSTFTVSLPHNV